MIIEDIMRSKASATIRDIFLWGSLGSFLMCLRMALDIFCVSRSCLLMNKDSQFVGICDHFDLSFFVMINRGKKGDGIGVMGTIDVTIVVFGS